MKQQEGGQQYQQKVVEHPQLFYRIDEVYSIRKESINNSNDQIYKRLSRQFQRIKKIKSQPQGSSILSQQYDYENCSFRKQFKRLHDLYNQQSKTHMVVKRRIQKMRHKVDKIKGQIQRDEYSSVKEVDPIKLIGKGQSQHNSNTNNSNGAQAGSKTKV